MDWMKKILMYSEFSENSHGEPHSGLRVFHEGLKKMVPTRLGKIAIRITWGAFLLVLLSASCCYSADVVFIRSPGGSSTEQEQLEIATNFYGLNLKVIIVSSANDDFALSKAIEREETIGVAVAANALAVVNRNALLRALHRKPGSGAPVLILGVAPDVDPIPLRTWSGGTTLGCKRLESLLRPQYMFARVDGLTWQLADLEIPLPIKNVFYLVLGKNSAVQRITSVRHDHQVFPVFIETTVQQRKVFIASAMPPDGGNADGEASIKTFLPIAPAMMFVRFCAGGRGWHPLYHYANFTIDDPWLRQPYGYLDYKGLLKEMDRHHFHTTIAFIPWNYDRSQPEVLSLFRDHPEGFSIAIHGNNHDHKEFTDYRSKPLDDQIADLKQSLARMERFQTLTGIQYDKVMIFPHSIAPEGTLDALKTYDYLATINSSNVPQGAVKPLAPSFGLRPVTLVFAGFPSIARLSVQAPIPKGYIAINEFLANPLLFYAHSDFFARGINAFDDVADEVNKLEPDTQWRSLGDIVRHLYLLKLRDDSNYDVLAFSSSICLDNTSGRGSIFYVQKQEIGHQTIKSVVVDGQPYPYRLQKGYLELNIAIPTGASRCAAIQYENDLELASIDPSHDSLVVYSLRMASDFRDIYLAKSGVGLAVIRFYNEHELKPARVLGSTFVLLVVCIYAGYRLRVCARNRRSPLNKAGRRSVAD
jgi:hypothetical protein